jgi:hypothetical protein
VALVVALAPPLAPAAPARSPVLVCGLTSADEAAAAVRLDDLLETATLVPGDPAACAGPPESVRAILAGRGPGRVAVLLEGPAMTLERLVPWLAAPEDGLIQLERSGRLASFAILLEALLAEYRLSAAALCRSLDGTPLPPPVAAAPPPAPKPERRRGGGRPSPRPAPPPVAPPVSPPVVRVEPPPPAPAPAPTPAPPPPPAPGPVASAVPAPPAPPTRSTSAPGGGGDPLPVPPLPARSSRPAFGPEASAGLRVREPNLVGLEVGAGLRLGRFFATLLFQPETSWTLRGRPLAVSSAAVELGLHHPLWQGEDARVSGRVAAVGERLELRQLDVEEGASHEALDAGVAMGLGIDRRVYGAVWAALGVEGIWLPTAGRVVLLNDGSGGPEPRIGFNGVGARATLGISWRK